MERSVESGDTKLLIDFNSPVSRGLLHTPLIPVPIDADEDSLSPTNTNPFDIVIKQTICSEIADNDPFECASNAALNNVNGLQQQACEKQEYNQPSSNINESLSGRNNTEKEALIEEKQKCCKNELFQLKNVEGWNNQKDEKTDLSGVSTLSNGITLVQNKTSFLKQADDNLSQISGDFSTEDNIKAVIAKRINKCIQKVLSNSIIKSKSDKSNENKNNEKKTVNRKSVSFTTNHKCDKTCDRLNKSCTNPSPGNDSFIVVNHDLNTPESSFGSCDITPLSFISTEVSKNDESRLVNDENPEKDEVFKEANKLARTFSKIAESFCKFKEDTDTDNDLLTCKPQWLYADSSEDEEDKLRKDPALNIRVSLTNSMTQGQPDSEALSAFKSKYKRSFSQGSDFQNENTLKRSLTSGTKPVIVPVMPLVSSGPVILEKQDANPLRLKKNPLGEIRKGPMRAVMPVQNMTKESLTIGVQMVRPREPSPVRKKNTSSNMISPIKDTSKLNMHPVASSTPNKCSTPISSVAISNVVPKNKRHSLGSTKENRKSRPPLAETGSRQRSSSANSSIPTPVSLTNRALGPRSTSNLIRGSAKVNTYKEKDPAKLLTKQTKSNDQSLNEVKPLASRPSRVRSTVNAISNMITGKNKKVAVQDKENRFPA